LSNKAILTSIPEDFRLAAKITSPFEEADLALKIFWLLDVLGEATNIDQQLVNKSGDFV
jgi:hypothetical protein